MDATIFFNLLSAFTVKYGAKISSLDTINFYRIDGNNEINTYGEQPQILYKKKQKKLSHSFEYKMAKKNYDNNILISDGGLKLKKQKYKTKYNYIYTKPANNQYNEEIKTILTNYALIYDKSAKKKKKMIKKKKLKLQLKILN